MFFLKIHRAIPSATWANTSSSTQDNSQFWPTCRSVKTWIIQVDKGWIIRVLQVLLSYLSFDHLQNSVLTTWIIPVLTTYRWLNLKILQGTWIDELFTMSFLQDNMKPEISLPWMWIRHIWIQQPVGEYTSRAKCEWIQEDLWIQIQQPMGLIYARKSWNVINYTLNSEHYWEDLFIH